MIDIQINALRISELLQFCFDECRKYLTIGSRCVILTEEPRLALRHNASPSALGWFRAAGFGSLLWGTRGMTKGEKSVDPPDEWEWRKRSRRLHSL